MRWEDQGEYACSTYGRVLFLVVEKTKKKPIKKRGQSGADGCSVLNLNSGARVCANADANVDANMDANASPCKRG